MYCMCSCVLSLTGSPHFFSILLCVKGSRAQGVANVSILGRRAKTGAGLAEGRFSGLRVQERCHCAENGIPPTPSSRGLVILCPPSFFPNFIKTPKHRTTSLPRCMSEDSVIFFLCGPAKKPFECKKHQTMGRACSMHKLQVGT